MPQYIAIDLKSFYASVECVERGLDPLTTNLVVADESRTEKTICLAVSPSLKKYGIPGRARLFEVVQKVKQVNRSRTPGEPELSYIAAPPRMALYVEYSTRIYDIYLKYVAPEDIHSYSIDEVFIDLTSYLETYHMSAHELTTRMIRNVQKETGITFKDVAGEDEAKESLQEVVDFLHNPQRYVKIGAKLPKGALLVGPPGTGKTLLAKAVAGEAKVPFFSLTGSDFIELYVGVGASRVRDLFKEATKNAPCIIFIDEIDAIGRSRDSKYGGGNEEREQTLNQLLSEMDGFDTSKGLLILAATNRPEVLDKALLRPGRFDRRIIVDKPDLKGRLETLKVHSKDVLMDETVDLDALALATAGLVGSDLANMINEAAINAVKKGRKYVNQADLFEAFELVAVGGKEKKDRVMSDKERKIVSYHEVGHAIVTALQKNTEPVQKITIVPRTMGALGYTLQTPEEEKFLQTKDELLAKITTYMAGRAAEVLVFSSATSGAANDIENATAIARAMVTQYGMSDKFGMMCLATTENQYLDNRAGLICGEETAAQIDGEVLSIINKCYDDAMQLLIENRESLDKISEYLYEHETITGKEFMKIFREIKGIPEPEEESTKKSFMEQAMDAERQSKGNDGE